MQGNWQKNGVGDFKYYVGISSLTQVASRDDRVCVLNILGGESSDVTPVSHAYSGGNVVCGTAPGKGGAVLETSIGNIPVYNSVRDALVAGRRFNCGVVYLPPSAARDGVAELIRVNPDLRKIFIITEKIAVHDAREIRAMGQHNGVDIFGANGLGVADSWNKVRIGGALGGDKPGDSLRPGSIAILSNSGGFSTTIAQYLRMAGWGTTTVISVRQGHLHPLRGARVRLCAGQRCTQQGGGAVLRAGRLLRARCPVHQAGGRLRRWTLEEQAHARRRTRRRDGGRFGRCARQGTLVHGEVRRRRPLHARQAGVFGKGRRGDQHRAHSRRTDGGDACQRDAAGLRRPRATWR